MLSGLGQQAIIGMLSHIIFIIITWQILQVIKLDPLLKKGRVFESRLLLIFLTITIGTTVSNFFLDFIQWSQQMTYLFK
ncbi:DUF1146 family protein [Aquibacillus salsiterrae]|uniref:DUF1146 family protein n=1 Tax=Aquibacillus salsiterrae TaxID=2950439 RepID=A0A9X3WD13_9BACI|nr:DUF1146 family protein [Aquibacillus salsiterrae]MDC3416728.1 DUF1146 family protein [Aquibacillus salsiterrae]